jgi:hypothetical protein
MPIKPSLRLTLLLLTFHMMVASVIFATLMPLAAKLVLVMLTLLSLLFHLARDALLLLPDSWRQISFEQGRLSVVTKDGSSYSGPMASQATVSPYFALLSVRPEGHRLRIYRAIFPDALDTGVFRGLCVRLKFS